ncbi:methyltransferase domain protein [Burkholderia ambifaria AMMD]|uniref:Beta-ketoacyl synthase n=1 Tax=Burkholderia ambifaria (strain ATCC BAA-244 / DSM 16087 / CCUG 44356 / LMG 19182 / AMMD) TaxID=339670 RepID=Q0B308_BURCM|nr:SDR family NAD(P)-dependent oxidoreductase [Burkholderia ambifaria]ABI91465.1 beta-ketoacyl synthase [Burkholderia ambifaria AMMD]AJY26223.1 methyltransferase domain protein [Burkholderia ambifaria AMMD]MBR7932291.1 SDR family NAD(P)-dependent oxidoreductase [Burkholderia ambifaria]QQC09105.1 SDR family NAD(P)-dependent oxidoreductase [Burkholderia ambifaria]UZU01051.1 SDR family NAD(P)-dependent oxidoreductase [Burkholderia ambifaria]
MNDYKALLKSSIRKIQEQDRRIRELESGVDEPVAIIGMSCRFPGAPDAEAFWRAIEAGADTVTTMTGQRWEMEAWHTDAASAEAAEAGRIYTRRFGLLEDIDGFEPGAFGISEEEAPYIDPQHRLLLEQAWFCLEHAGLDAKTVKGSDIGVFVGQMNNDYARLIRRAEDLNPYVGAGSAPSAAAGRLSYVFGLKGPSITIDTACSSSLVAVHLASQSLRLGECGMALAGGVNLLLSPETAVGACVARMLSARGRCNTFGGEADGYVRAEGCGLVLLKTLSRARADGDTVLAVIRGSAVNQDGRSHGLSAPNGPAQVQVMRDALARARLDPAEVGYLETHGTGTPLGDPVEVQAIDTVYGRAEGRRSPLALGAVKANMGHGESAAGIAGLIKLVQLLRHDSLPPVAHLDALNPHFDGLSDQLLFPKGAAAAWPQGRPSVAALSSFGYTGTNAHLLLSPGDALDADAEAARPAHRFERRRYWLPDHMTARAGALPALFEPVRHPFFATSMNEPDGGSLLAGELSLARQPFLRDHVVAGEVVLPASCFVDMVVHACAAALGAPARIEQMSLLQPCVLGETPLGLYCRVGPRGGDTLAVDILTRRAGREDWQHHVRASVRAVPAAAARQHDLAADRAACPEPVSPEALRREAREAGVAYGPAFRAIEGLWRGPGVALGRIVRPAALGAGWNGPGLHPVMLDACFQVIGAAAAGEGGADGPRGLFVPAALHGVRDGVQDGGPRAATLWCVARIDGPGAPWADDASLHDYLRGRDNFSVQLRVCDEQGRELLSIERFEAARYRPRAAAEAWRDWLLERHWLPAGAPRATGFALTAAALVADLGADANAASYVVSDALRRGFDEIAAGYVARALDALELTPARLREGVPSAQQLESQYRIAPEHHRLVRRLLALRETLPAPSRSTPEIEAELRRALGGETRELDLLVRCGEVLADVLRGRVGALTLLFEPARTADVEAVYQDSAGSRALNDRIAALLERLATSRPEGRPLRVLEVGAGTGATTSRLLPVLRGRAAEYVFTDISAHFLHRAQDKFAGDAFLSYRTLDLERPPGEQGFEAGEFDVVIAVNVVHATADIARSLAHLSSCLTEGGMLVLREVTEPQAWLDLSFGLTPGWWGFADAPLREHGPLLDAAQWEQVLREQGFEPALATAEAGRTESVIVARRTAASAAGHCVVFADRDAWSAGLVAALRDSGRRVSVVEAEAGAERAPLERDDFAARLEALEAEHGGVDELVYAWSARPAALDTVDPETAAEPYLREPLALCQALLLPRWRQLEASFLTAGAQAVAGRVSEPLQALLWGHLPAFVNENARFARIIDVDRDEPAGAALLGALAQREDCQIAVRGEAGFVPRLRRAALVEAGAPVVSAEASYLVTGGFGALGIETARALAAQGARHLLLLGRRLPPSAEVALAGLREQGVAVHTLLADVGDEASLRAALAGVPAELPPLRGVVHSVGVLDDGVIGQQSWARYQRVLHPKLGGALLLHRLLAPRPLDFFVLYSSAAGLMGNPGQANHAAASAFLDAFAWYLRGRGVPAVALDWGAWSEIGAAAARDVGARLGAEGSIAGVIAPEQGAAVMARQFGCANTQLAVLPLKLNQPIDASRQPQVRRLLAELLAEAPAGGATQATGAGGVTGGAAADAEAGDAWLDRLLRVSTRERRRELGEYLEQTAGSLLRRPGAIDGQASLFDQGLDSLLAIDLRGTLERRFEQRFESTLLFDHPSVAALTEFLLGALAEQVPRAAAAPASSTAHAAPARVVEADAADAAEPAFAEGAIAVISMACRFPGGANSPEAFWELLANGVDTAGPIPPERWDHSRYYDSEKGKPGKAYVKEGCFVDSVDRFYPERFGIAGIEAELMDPQQRMLLDVCYEAFERAGLDPASLGGSETGVFMGVMTQDYLQLTQHVRDHAFYVGTGTANSIVSGRIAHTFGLMGPAMTIDTACSSSLVTVQLACEQLRSGACDMAVAGGVSLQLTPEPLVLECAGGMLSPTGRCRTFDADADGFVRGEGCGVVVLKRLADAVAAGDPVVGVIRGGAVAHDGRAGGLTVPNGLAQQRVLEKALADAGIARERVSYVEAHGTGTHLGDPIELNALQAVYGRTPRDTPLLLGSVKTNIGHAEAAAGIAGLIKVLLAMRHETLPPHLHYRRANPNFDWTRGALEVVGQRRGWHAAAPLVAGVSSFGLSGTNAHLLVEQYVAPVTLPDMPAGFVPLAMLSQVDRAQLAADAERYAAALANGAELADLAYTLSVSRAGHALQAVLPAGSVAQLRDALLALAAGTVSGFERPAASVPLEWRLGDGARPVWAAQAVHFYDLYPAFRDAVDACVEGLRVRGRAPVTGRALCQGDAAAFEAAILVYAFGRLLQRLGVQPERIRARGPLCFVAAALGGALDLDTMLDGLVAEDARAVRAALAQLGQRESEVSLAFEPQPSWQVELNEAAALACRTHAPARKTTRMPAVIDLPAASLDARPLGGLAALVAALPARGQRIDWHAYFEPSRARRIALPASHFPARRYWVPQTAPSTTPAGGLVVADLTSARDGSRYVEFALDRERHPFLDEHRLGRDNVLPAAGSLAFVLHALGREALAGGVTLDEVRFLRPLRFGARLDVQLEIGADGQASLHERAASLADRAARAFATVAKLSLGGGPTPAQAEPWLAALRALREQAPARQDGEAFYRDRLPPQLWLGAGYRRIEALVCDGGLALAEIATVHSDFLVDPRVLDACLQAVNAIDTGSDEPAGASYLPYALRRVWLAGWPAGRRMRCLVRHLPEAGAAGELVYDLALIDEQERVFALIEHARFRRAALLAVEDEAVPAAGQDEAARAAPAAAEPAIALPDEFAQLMPDAKQDLVARLVRELLVRFLKIDAGAVSDERPFFELGMDSVSALEFSDELGACFALDLHVDTIFDYPSVASLSAYLLERLAAAQARQAPPGPAGQAAPADAALPIDELSALLRQEMGDD